MFCTQMYQFIIKCVLILPVSFIICSEVINEPNVQEDAEHIIFNQDQKIVEIDKQNIELVENSDEVTGPVNTDAADKSHIETQISADENNTLNGTSKEANNTDNKIHCVLRILPEGEIPQVKIMNLSSLLNALTPVPNITDGECAIVFFYSPWCIFSARAAPHFNALARAFPYIYCYAIDAVQYSNLHMRYGLIAVPTILLFQNGRAVAKYNGSHSSLEKFANFVTSSTGMVPDDVLNVTSADMTGPIPANLKEQIDYILILSWVFTICCLCIWFLKSSFCHRIVESVKNTWREAEAQHEHEE